MRGSILLQCLQPGESVTIGQLAKRSGLAIADIESTIDRLIEWGVPIIHSSVDQLALTTANIPLDFKQISEAVAKSDRALARNIEVFDEIDSTNLYLMKLPQTALRHKHVCLAEYMTAGRGRQSRKWHGGAYQNVILSLAWQYDGNIEQLTGLSLAVAVMIVRCLESFSNASFKLKWPNDVLVDNRKLSGILIEIRDEFIIIGIGVNCDLTTAQQERINQPVTSLSRIMGQSVDRNTLIPRLLIELSQGLEHFFVAGLEPFRNEWLNLHAYRDRRVRVEGRPVREGIAKGIDQKGALVIRLDNGELQAIHSGTVNIVSG